MGLPMLAVAAQSLPPLSEGQKQSLKLITEEIVKKQQPDGSWEFFATLRRPPINESPTTDAAWIILALQGETGPDAPEAQRETLVMLKVAGMSLEEVARATSSTVGAVKQRAHRAYETLRRALGKERGDGGLSR